MSKRDWWLDEAAIGVAGTGLGAWVGQLLQQHPVIGAVVGAIAGAVLAGIVRYRYIRPLAESEDASEKLASQLDATKNELRMAVGRIEVGERASLEFRVGWDDEERVFRDAASSLWNLLIPKFEVAGFIGQGSARSGLRDSVRAAPWPDDSSERDQSSSLWEAVLSEFCNRACAHSGDHLFGDTSEFLFFDDTRREVSRILREWAGRSRDEAFVAWLREKLPWPRQAPTTPSPYHSHTVKLTWYLELATAGESGNGAPDCAFLPALRDALSQQLPLRLGGDADGYLTDLPPKG